MCNHVYDQNVMQWGTAFGPCYIIGLYLLSVDVISFLYISHVALIKWNRNEHVRPNSVQVFIKYFV